MHRLALALGYTVNELLDKLTASELQDWQEYYTIEPFGERRADLRNALLCLLIAEPNRDKKKRPEPFKMSDFLLYDERRIDQIRLRDEEQRAEERRSELAPAKKEVRTPVPGRASIDANALTYLFVASAVEPPPSEEAKE